MNVYNEPLVCDKLNTRVPILVNAICNDAFKLVRFATTGPVLTPWIDAFKLVMLAVNPESVVCNELIDVFNAEILDAVCDKATTEAFKLVKLAVKAFVLMPWIDAFKLVRFAVSTPSAVCKLATVALIPDILEATCALNIVRLVPFK